MVNSAATSETVRKPGIRAAAAIGWTVLATLLLAAGGTWPTYALSGAKGLEAMLTAGLIVGGVGCLAIGLVVMMSPEGGGKLALAFILSGMGKVLVCVALGLLAAMLLPVPPAVFLLWLVLFYVTVLLVQIFWLVKKIRQGSR